VILKEELFNILKWAVTTCSMYLRRRDNNKKNMSLFPVKLSKLNFQNERVIQYVVMFKCRFK